MQNNDPVDEQESHSLIEDPVLASHIGDEENDLSLTGEVQEEILSSEMMIQQDNETTPVINEYELSNSGCDLRYSHN